MKKKGVIIGVIIAVIVIIAVSIIGSYNGLISLEESTNTAYSDIQVQLQRRMDLVPNLVNTVKGYAAHETEVFTAVSDARAKLAGAGTVEEASEANEELSSVYSCFPCTRQPSVGFPVRIQSTKNPCRGPWFRQGKQLLFFTQTAPPHRSRRRTG